MIPINISPKTSSIEYFCWTPNPYNGRSTHVINHPQTNFNETESQKMSRCGREVLSSEIYTTKQTQTMRG